jgi:hypothetical protein
MIYYNLINIIKGGRVAGSPMMMFNHLILYCIWSAHVDPCYPRLCMIYETLAMTLILTLIPYKLHHSVVHMTFTMAWPTVYYHIYQQGLLIRMSLFRVWILYLCLYDLDYDLDLITLLYSPIFIYRGL